MEQEIKLTLKRVDAEVLVKSLEHRKQRLCDIRREICPPEHVEPYEQEECAYFEQEDQVVERVLEALRVGLETKSRRLDEDSVNHPAHNRSYRREASPAHG